MIEGNIRIGDGRAVVSPCNGGVHVTPRIVLELPSKGGHASDVEVVYPLFCGRRLGVAEPVLVGSDVGFVRVKNTHIVFGVGQETRPVEARGPARGARVVTELTLETQTPPLPF